MKRIIDAKDNGCTFVATTIGTSAVALQATLDLEDLSTKTVETALLDGQDYIDPLLN